MIFYDDRGHCPKCGRFCGQIFAYGNESRGLFKVKGFCKVHGEVDLTDQSWTYEEFFRSDVEIIEYIGPIDWERRVKQQEGER